MPFPLQKPIVLLAALAAAAPLHAQSDHGSIVVVTGQYPGLPIPTLIQGSSNQDVADLLFLRLARVGPTVNTNGDHDFVPQLARRWVRKDSLTIVFELDDRARWHDGATVTAHDVVFSFTRARDASVNPTLATLLRDIASVTAPDDHHVVITFARAYPSQFYDATYQVQILPAHLLEKLAPTAIASSDFAQHPVGDGPFTWVRSAAGQFVELAATKDYFLGQPRLDRVIFRVGTDADTRMNLLLSGEGDALENVLPVANQDRVRADSDLRLVAVPSFLVGYLLYNQRDAADTARPNAILSDHAVRAALTLALDRAGIAQGVFGSATQVPIGPASLSLWARIPEAAAPQDVARARQLLADAGWRDTDGDGILDKGGRKLSLDLIFPSVSAARRQTALRAQADWKAVGVDATVEPLDFAVYLSRRNAGKFDIDVNATNQDPNPSGLAQSWSCAGFGGSNVAHFCDPKVDSLLRTATTAQDGLALYRQALRTIDDDAAAAFVFAPPAMIAVHRRFANVVFHPESYWSGLGDWSVTPGRQLPRDRDAGR